MLKRVFVAAIGIPLLLAALFQPGGKVFVGVAAAVGLIGVLEIAGALRSKGRPVRVAWPLLWVGALTLSYLDPRLSAVRIPGLSLLFVLALAGEALTGKRQPIRQLSALLPIAAYPGLMAVAAALRLAPGVVRLGSLPPLDAGAVWVLIALLFVWVTDTGAYFVGRLWGRRKLAPKLSPSKTWEGAIGGWLFAVALGGWVGTWGAFFPGGMASGLALGALAGAWGQVGDLAESAMKRELGVKDLGGWLPGHGGALDRFDSFLFVCPLVYLWSLFAVR